MPRPRPDHPTARFATPLAAFAALAACARFELDPSAAAECGYLALALGLALVTAAAVAPRPSVEAVAGSLLATIAVWAVPPGPARGAVALVIGAGALAVAAARWLPFGEEGDEEDGRRLPLVPVLALAFGLQSFLRAGELLGPGSTFRAVALFVVFPLVGAVAMLALARLHGRRRALLAGAAALVVGPGFRPATLAALVALAAASWLFAREPPAVWSSRPEVGSRGRSAARLAVRLGAGVVLLAPFAWDPPTAGVCLGAGLAAAVPVAASGRRWLAGAAIALPLVVVFALPGRPFAEALPLASLAVLAVPALALPERDRTVVALSALLVALAAARGATVDGALAPAACLAALAVPRRGSVAGVQGGWSATLLGASALLGAYPWLREAPLANALALFGLEPSWPGALAAVVALALLAGVAAVATRKLDAGRSERAAARAAGLAALALALVHLPAPGVTPVTVPGLVLAADRSTWSLGGSGVAEEAGGWRGGDIGSIVVDSALANAAALPAGTPVATLRLQEAGEADRTWTLRVGEETGEWASGRPDLRAEGVPAPPAWASWVAEGGGFFGRRYRSVHRLDEPVTSPDRIELALRSDLPEGVELTVFHLELRP